MGGETEPVVSGPPEPEPSPPPQPEPEPPLDFGEEIATRGEQHSETFHNTEQPHD